MPLPKVNTSQTITVTGPITYADLVAFVNRIGSQAQPHTRINVKQGKMGSPYEQDPDSLSITFTVV